MITFCQRCHTRPLSQLFVYLNITCKRAGQGAAGQTDEGVSGAFRGVWTSITLIPNIYTLPLDGDS